MIPTFNVNHLSRNAEQTYAVIGDERYGLIEENFHALIIVCDIVSKKCRINVGY